MGIRSVSTVRPWQEDLGEGVAGAFQALAGQSQRFLRGMPETAAGIVSQWQDTFATPVMNMWRKSIAPILEEGYNLPGSFHSRSKFEGLAQQGGEFLSGSVMPSLFSALENMRARTPMYGQIYAGVLGQGAGLATSQTMQSFYKDKSWVRDFASLAGTASSIGADIATMGKKLR